MKNLHAQALGRLGKNKPKTGLTDADKQRRADQGRIALAAWREKQQYQQAFADAQAGGMTNDDAHEFAADQATRVKQQTQKTV